MKKIIMLGLMLWAGVWAVPLAASEAQYRADSAVADILFEYDGSQDFASYVVGEDGFVDITFARNIPDELYSEILQRLKDSEDVTGVLAGTSGPACVF